jgi:HEAT repeat protein
MRPFISVTLCLLTIAAISISAGCARKQSKTPSYQGHSLKYWTAKADSEVVADRRAAAQALGKCGPEALPALLKLRYDANHRVRANATLAVAEMDQKAVPKLRELIHDQDEKVRAAAIETLIQIFLNMREKGAQQIVNLLEDESPAVRFHAARSFTRMDRKLAVQAIPQLKKLLSDENVNVRSAAALSLSIIQPTKPRFSSPGKTVKTH